MAFPVAPQHRPAAYKLGERYVLRRRERLILAAKIPVELGSRAVEVLLVLVEADGVLLTKSDLLDKVWPSVAVEENNLQVQVSALRRALGPEGRGWIATIPGQGYRFVGPVTPLGPEDEAVNPPPPKVTETRRERRRAAFRLHEMVDHQMADLGSQARPLRVPRSSRNALDDMDGEERALAMFGLSPNLPPSR